METITILVANNVLIDLLPFLVKVADSFTDFAKQVALGAKIKKLHLR